MNEYLAKRVGKANVSVGGYSPVVFHVGDTPFAKSKGLLSSSMEEEVWTIRSFGPNVVLNGGGTRGCLYAVYHFLEDHCGIRWWSEKEEDVLYSGSLALPKLNIKDKPAFIYRDICRSLRPNVATSQFAVRRRLNCNWAVPMPMTLGGGMTFGPPDTCHTFDKYVPFDKYAKEHPEYFALHKGKRADNKKDAQLCLSNPDVFRLLLEGVFENIRKGTEKAKAEGLAVPRLYDVSQNDNRFYCECPACAAESAKVGLSGQYLKVINAIAAEVAKTHPDVYLVMFAYLYTLDPPKEDVKPAPNVLVRYCPIAANFATSFLDSYERNVAMRKPFDGWAKRGVSLFIWDYAITFGQDTRGYPFPNELYFGEKLRHYADNRVRGIMWEQEWPHEADLFDIKYYLLTKLAENPRVDYESLLKRTFSEYFGAKAGSFVYAARRRLAESKEKKNPYLTFLPSYWMFTTFIGESDAAFMTEMYDRAEKAAAGDERYLRRIRRARVGIDKFVARGRSLLQRGTCEGKPCWLANPEVFGAINRLTTHIVKDPAAPTGKTLELAKKRKYLSPMPIRYYNGITKKSQISTHIKIDDGETKYVWRDVGRVTVEKDAFFIMTGESVAQIYVPPSLAGNVYDVKLLVCKSPEGKIRIGRLALIDIPNK